MQPSLKTLLTEAAADANIDRETLAALLRAVDSKLLTTNISNYKRGRIPLAPDASALLAPLRRELASLAVAQSNNVWTDADTRAYFERYIQLLKDTRDTINLFVAGKRALPLAEAIAERHAHGQPAGMHWTDWLSDKVKAKVQASYDLLMASTPGTRRRRRPFTDPETRPRNVAQWDAFLERTRKRITDMEQNLHYEPALKTPEGHDAATTLLDLYRTVYARAKDRRDGKHRTAPGQPLPAAPVSLHALLDAEERAALDNALARLDVARGIHHEKGDTDEEVAD